MKIPNLEPHRLGRFWSQIHVTFVCERYGIRPKELVNQDHLTPDMCCVALPSGYDYMAGLNATPQSTIQNSSPLLYWSTVYASYLSIAKCEYQCYQYR